MGSPKSHDSIELSDSPQPSQPPPDLVAEQTFLPGSFTVKGDLIADEKTLIEGQVKGDVLVRDHQVRIGRTERVEGEVFAIFRISWYQLVPVIFLLHLSQ